MNEKVRKYSIKYMDKLIEALKSITNLSEEGISIKLGYNEGYISQTRTRGEVSEKFINALNRELAATTPAVSYMQSRQNLKNGEKPDVPVLGGFTTLGHVEVYDDDNEKDTVIAKLPATIFPGCDHSERAKGDSMYPLIMNQAFLVGKKCKADGITYGEKYIIRTNTGKDTTKYVHPGKNKTLLILKAYNKNVPDQEIRIADIIFACRVHFIINPT